jgi:6-phosphogluconolactonase
MSKMTIRVKQFGCPDELYQALADLMAVHIVKPFGTPHAIMLAGGKTPMPAYQEVAHRRLRAADDLFFMYSDERMTPVTSAESNFGCTRFLMDAMAMDAGHVMRVQTELELKKAAVQYGNTLEQFLKAGGRITLGLLGLGSDGHTASLFSADDVRRGAGSMAVAVRRPEKPDRVSVSPDLLKRVETIIFLALGAEKREAIQRLLKQPERCPAGMAIREARSVQLWTA